MEYRDPSKKSWQAASGRSLVRFGSNSYGKVVLSILGRQQRHGRRRHRGGARGREVLCAAARAESLSTRDAAACRLAGAPHGGVHSLCGKLAPDASGRLDGAAAGSVEGPSSQY